VSRLVQATCRYFLFHFGPGPARSGVSSPQMTRARMISARMVLFAAATAPAQQLGGDRFPAEEQCRVLFFEGTQPPVPRIDHPRHADQRWRRHPIGPGQPVVGIDDLRVALAGLHPDPAAGINGIPAVRASLQMHRTCGVPWLITLRS
jgi:hypothetical protein